MVIIRGLKRIGFPLLLLLLALSLIFTISGVSTVMHAASQPEKPTKLIILDAGHGGFDGGAVVNDTMEKNINLNITLILADLLRTNGYRVIMTRETDTGTDNTSSSKIRSRKVSDLNNRLALMKKHEDAIFVSIHLNKYTDSQPKGTQVFYSPKVAVSKELAGFIQTKVAEQLQNQNTRVIKQGTKDAYLLYNAPIPAVIVECGFMSNPAELAQLKDSQYQAKMAFSIYCGMMDYYNLSEAGI